jgi:paraquat-inducible protein B
MQADNARSALTVGLFFVGGLLLLALLLSFFGEGSLFRSKQRAVAHFEGSLSGLNVGAPVTFRGVKVGRVEAIELRIDADDASARIPVYLSLNPDAAQWNGDKALDIERLVARGLRAQLASQSFVTGQLYIELDFHRDAPPRRAITAPQGAHPEIPTLPSETAQFIDFFKELPMQELVEALRNTLTRIDRMTATIEAQFEPMSRDVAESLQTLNTAIPQLRDDFSAIRASIETVAERTDATLRTVDDEAARAGEEVTKLSAEMRAAAASLHRSSAEIEGLLASDAPARRDLEAMLRDLARSARALRDFSESIEERPDRLLFGP